MIPKYNEWPELLKDEFDKDYYIKLQKRLQKEYENNTIYPKQSDIFNALHYTSYHQTKVVIIGQDPYHGEEQAHGFSFSVKPGNRIPPSLRNIYKELKDDLGVDPPSHGYLTSWAEQGVLLLNDVLTVRAHEPNSHRGLGWESFTNAIIHILNQREEPLVFILWGKKAQSKGASIDSEKHLVITSSHPSPFAAHKGFYGSRPFSKANNFLQQHNRSQVDWRLPQKMNET